MAQMRELAAEAAGEPRPRRGVRRPVKTADARGRFARRGAESATAPEAHERLMTAGLRLSIVGAIAAMTLFFHAALGAAVAALFS